jgi:hypothetical protein
VIHTFKYESKKSPGILVGGGFAVAKSPEGARQRILFILVACYNTVGCATVNFIRCDIFSHIALHLSEAVNT